MVVKAMGYDGTRLSIRKATLREWRRQFAWHLREQGVAANATERAARGVTRPQKRDGIYRAERRRDSTHWRRRTAAVAREMTPDGEIKPELGKAELLETRYRIVRGWNEIAGDLARQGQADLAQEVRRFVTQLPPVRTEREWIRDRMLEQAKGSDRAKFADRWKQDALASWQVFRAQQQQAQQARLRQLEQARKKDLEKKSRRNSRTHRDDRVR